MWNMTIILCTFVGLMGVLVFAFINFDVLVQIEYRKYKDEWSIDGKPRGFFWRPPESTWFASSIATQKLSFRWLFQTPHWVKNDTEAICRLKRLRLSVLIFNAGIFLWLIISILLSENYIKPAGWRWRRETCGFSHRLQVRELPRAAPHPETLASLFYKRRESYGWKSN